MMCVSLLLGSNKLNHNSMCAFVCLIPYDPTFVILFVFIFVALLWLFFILLYKYITIYSTV